MCGILGVVSFGDKKICPERFCHSLEMMNHRGPDGTGIYHNQNIMLGHKRLSIIDLNESANQPMHSEDSCVSVIFNGEIYNYIEIRQRLIYKGYSFRTQGDTEVIINAYLEYGIDCVREFIGMFSICIYDSRSEETFLVRDRLGIKPLYYSFIEDNFLFGSEIKPIVSMLDGRLSLNFSAVISYFRYRYSINNDTLFNEVSSLPPAHYIVLDKFGKKEFVEYWDLKGNIGRNKSEDYIYYENELKSLLHSAVRYRLKSDVPVGAFLSGGVDSSVISTLMGSYTEDKIKTYTIGFSEKGFNEFEYASLVAKENDFVHKEILISADDYVAVIENLIDKKGSPLSVPNEVPLYLMSQELKKDVTVVLSGEGADEIFGGYGRIFRSGIDLVNSGRNPECNKDQLGFFLERYRYINDEQLGRVLSENVFTDGHRRSADARLNEIFHELADKSYEDKMFYTFEKVHLPGLLQRVDNATMAASVEARVPFTDHRLVEFSFSIPFEHKLRWNEGVGDVSQLSAAEISENYDTPKYILKKAFENEVNHEVLYRKKMGFPVPLKSWFEEGLNQFARQVLLSDEAKSRGIYKIDGIERILNNPAADENESMLIWMLINLEMFMVKFFRM